MPLSGLTTYTMVRYALRSLAEQAVDWILLAESDWYVRYENGESRT